MEIETTIAPAGFHLNHPELHHYTSLAGLEGILGSGILWATHFQSLNDRSEVTHLQKDLTEALAQAIIPVIDRLRLTDRRILGEMRAAGGLATFARRHAKVLIDSFYRVAFTGISAQAMAVPYITSFCSHATDQEYEKRNGLLSQWRGYGKDGGCCLVFDTRQLIDVLTKESYGFYWVAIGLDEVTYATPDIVVASEYSTLVSELARLIEGGIRRQVNWMPASEEGVSGFIEAATRFKHQGFREEREVRIVAVPGSAATSHAAAREHPREFVQQPIKEVRHTVKENRNRPYLRLFDTLAIKVPVTRIIVGPSRQQDANLSRVSAAVGRSIEVVPSATPFVE
jgi:Protein of unknown function (DUF2971)